MNSEAEIKRLSKLVFRAELFTFMAPDRLAIVRARWISWKEGWKCSADILAFPLGDIVSTREIPHCPDGLSFESDQAQRSFRRAADPNFLIIDYAVAADRGGFGFFRPSSYAPTDVYVPKSNARTKLETCAIEAKTGRIIQSNSSALDVFGKRYVNEVRPGEVGLWDTDKGLLFSIVVSKK